MFLESIEIEGFKSYGSKGVVGPMDKTFTAVTGLNGTGKSNILDAVCFVLGIDSPRLLRSASMKDLIFKQSKSIKGEARATLVFNNRNQSKALVGYEDIPEIHLTRVISEDGRTKYLLNHHNVTTKTVTRLLQSVGLSAPKTTYREDGKRQEKTESPYFIVMQGRVSKILNMKNNQLLSLLEECAGTSVYRAEKHKAYATLEKKEKKLLETQETLSKTIFPFLERLRKERSEFYAYKEAKKKEETLKQSIQHHQDTVDYLHNKELEAQIAQLNTQKSEIETQIEAHTASLIDSQVPIQDTDIVRIQKTIDSKKREISIMMPEVLQEEAFKLEQELKRIETRITQTIHEYSHQPLLIPDPEETSNPFLQETASLEHENISQQSIQPETTTKKESNREIENSHIERQEIKERTVQRTIANLDVNIEALSEKGKSLRKVLNTGRQARADKTKEIQSTTAQIDTLYEKHKRLLIEIDSLKRKHALTEDRAAKCITAHKENSPENIQKYRKEIESIKNTLGYPLIEGVYGKVSELLTVTNPKYITAVGVVLGGRKDFLVVENEQVGKQVIEIVSAQGKRIDIIPLNRISSTKLSAQKERACREEESMPLIEAIEYDQKVSKAMEYIFNGYILAPDRKRAIHLRDTHSITSVTLEGELFDRRGTITGGNLDTSKFVFKPSQGKRLSELEIQLDKAKETLKAYPLETLTHAQKLLSLISQKDTTYQSIQGKEALLATLDTEETPQEKDLERTTSQLTKLRSIHQTLTTLQKDLKDKKEKYASSATRLSEVQGRIALLTEDITALDAQKIDGIQSNEVNRARRSIQGKEEKRLTTILSQLRKDKHRIDQLLTTHTETLLPNTPRPYKPFLSHSLESLRLSLSKQQAEYKHLLKGSQKEINPKNIEMLEKNEELEQTLKERINRLQKNKTTIQESINRLNSLEKTTIENIFNQVNEKIGKYIQHFIPNGNARLEAVNGSPMNGVELLVKIGTWKKGLSELSGGQKSICALSLIFSLLSARPSPLYILDEIDAALDASHTEAMGKLIRSEFKDSQFLIVSLKNGMYHNANALFQTYIREGSSGVQKIK
ncbi:structural maintenance of chromosome 2 [Nematocida sp. AWRm80]|nr:structural maintenance of chromosome 2 [Nematocida sp. AWRm80]